MRHPIDLRGRDALIHEVQDLLKAGRSVQLFGPEAIGKSAVIAAVARREIVTIDPFQHLSPQRACQVRRALDHGVVHLVASRVARGHELGSVGRILWRFSTVRVRELADAHIRRIVADQLGSADGEGVEPDANWFREIVALSRGRPGFAAAMGRFALAWRRQHGYLPMPPLAFAATREDATIRTLRLTVKADSRPVET